MAIPQTFPRRQGTVNYGWQYETATAAILSLYHCQESEVGLAKNVYGVANFDDIVLFKPSVNNTFLIQVKYSNRQELITREDLIVPRDRDKSTGQFSIPTIAHNYTQFMNSIYNIRNNRRSSFYQFLRSNNSDRNIRYVLHTNRRVADCDLLEEVEAGFYFSAGLNVKMYKFNMSVLTGTPDLQRDLDLNLLENLYLFVEDKRYSEVEATLVTEFQSLLARVDWTRTHLDEEEVERSAAEYSNFIKRWENNDCPENFLLNGGHIKTKVSQMLLQPFRFNLRDYGPFRNVTDGPLNRGDVVVIDYARGNFHPVEDCLIKQKMDILSNNPMTNCVMFHGARNGLHSYWCFWMRQLLPLVVVIEDEEAVGDVLKIIGWVNFGNRVILANATNATLEDFQGAIDGQRNVVQISAAELLEDTDY